MALKGSVTRRFSAWTTNSNLANIATASRSYSFWYYALTEPTAMWGWDCLGWYENDYPFVPGGSAKQSSFRLFQANGSTLASRHYNSAGTLLNYSNNAVTTYGWHHMVITVDASSKPAYYIDGSSVMTNGAVATATNIFSFGLPRKHTSGATDSSCYNGMANCLIADLCVWNGILSSGERTALYASGKPTYTRTSASPTGVSTALLARFPFEDSMEDVVGGTTTVFACNFAPEFSTLSPFTDAATSRILNRVTNSGVATKYIFGKAPSAFIINLADSFGSLGQGRLGAPLYNKLSNGRMGPVYYPLGLSSTSNNNGTVQSVASANAYRVEGSTTRTITSSSYSGTTLTITYNGPNLIPGTTIKTVSGGVYYTVATFTAGTGTGTSQVGAIITCTTASNPGNLAADTLTVHCALPGTMTEWYDTTGNSSEIGRVDLSNVTANFGASQLGYGGTLNRFLDWLSCVGGKLRIYHRVASDINQQVKAIKYTTLQNNNTDTTAVTVSGLDNINDAGKIKTLCEIPFADVRAASSGEAGTYGCTFKLKPTGTAADSQNRYLCIVGYEVVLPNAGDGLGFAAFTEGSWAYIGVGNTYPGLKQMDQFTINTVVKSLVDTHPTSQFIIMFNMDTDSWTAAQYKAIYTATKAAWDAAFDAAGYIRPKYLIFGMYFHEVSGGSLAANRDLIYQQNLGAMQFAQAYPKDVENISLYAISQGVFLPTFEQSVLPVGPTNYVDGAVMEFEDARISPTPLNITDATWNNGTLTLTKTNGFIYHLFTPTNSMFNTYAYVEATSNTATPVVAGWYRVSSMTASTLVFASSITGGSAGVGADVRIRALWTVLFTGLHLTAFGPSVVSDWIIQGMIESISTSSRATNDINKPSGDSSSYQFTGRATVAIPNKPTVSVIDDGSSSNIRLPRVNSDVQPFKP